MTCITGWVPDVSAPRTLSLAYGSASEYRCWITYRKRAPATEWACAAERAEMYPARGRHQVATLGGAGPTQRGHGAGRRRKARYATALSAVSDDSARAQPGIPGAQAGEGGRLGETSGIAFEGKALFTNALMRLHPATLVK